MYLTPFIGLYRHHWGSIFIMLAAISLAACNIDNSLVYIILPLIDDLLPLIINILINKEL